MAEVIHRRLKEYRIWNSFSDRYITPPMSRKDLIAYLTANTEDHPRAVKDRVTRADQHGTSSINRDGTPNPRDDQEWETERCLFCEDFHHEAEMVGDECTSCGGARDVIAHDPVCTSAPTIDAGPSVAERMADWEYLWEAGFQAGEELKVPDIVARASKPGTWEWCFILDDKGTTGTIECPNVGQVPLQVATLILGQRQDWTLVSLLLVQAGVPKVVETTPTPVDDEA